MKKPLISWFIIIFSAGMAGAQYTTYQPEKLENLIKLLKKSPPDTNRVSLLVRAGRYYVLKPREDKKDLDSAQPLFDSALELSEQLHSDKWINFVLGWKGTAYMEADDTAKGGVCFMKIVDYYRQSGDKRQEANTWLRWAECIRAISNACIDAKRRRNEQAYLLYQQLHDTLNEAKALKEMADGDLNRNNLSLSEQELLQVISLYNAVHYPQLHYTYHLLASLYRERGDLNKELFYFLECIKSVEANHDTLYSFFFYQQIGITYMKLGMTDKSLEYYKRAWIICEKRRDYDYCYKIALNILDILLPAGRAKEALGFLSTTAREHPPEGAEQRKEVFMGFANCYAALKEQEKAEKYYLEMVRLSDSVYITQWVTTTLESHLEDYSLLCKFYIDSRNYKKAGSYLKKMAIPPGFVAGARIKSDIELYKFKVDSAKGDYLSAIGHFALHKRLEDSILNATKAQQIEKLQIGYETEQKDKDLQLQSKNIQLLTKQSQLQQSQVEQSRATRNWSFVGVCMLLLLLGLGYSRYRLKQKKNIELEDQKKEISAKNGRLEQLLTENDWLLREVHHRIKNNLQIIMSLLHSQSAYLQDEAALNAVLDSQHRVQAMALIHQKLYKANNVSSIYMQDYVNDLTEYLKDSFDSSRSVCFMVEIAPVKLDVAYAIPLGLIINEVVTNAIKYAFAGEGREEEIKSITIRLTQGLEDEMTLYIADNGRGLPAGFDIGTNDSFGMMLIRGLTEDIGAEMSIENKKGTAFRIEFRATAIKEND